MGFWIPCIHKWSESEYFEVEKIVHYGWGKKELKSKSRWRRQCIKCGLREVLNGNHYSIWRGLGEYKEE